MQACCICGWKKRRQRGVVFLILHFKRIRAERQFEKRKAANSPNLMDGHMNDLRLAGAVCLKCAKEISDRFDRAIEKAQDRQ